MRPMQWFCVMAGAGLLASASVPALAAAAPDNAAAHPSDWHTIEEYCTACHNATDWAGSIAFDTMSADDVPNQSKIFEAAIKRLRSGLMPPRTEKQPERTAVNSLI